MILTPGPLSLYSHDRDAAGLVYVYPVLSRRAGGVSIGINLNPNNACNWHCVYCQVPGLVRGKAPPIDLDLLERELEGFLVWLVREGGLEQYAPEGQRRICDIAFSGNGEPTSAREFAQAVERVVDIRARLGLEKDVIIRLITNGSLMAQANVQAGIAALGQAGGEVWFKVDAGTRAEIARTNGVMLDPRVIARHLASCASLCRTWVQTCLFRWDGAAPDEYAIAAYIDVLETAGMEKLAGVLLYGIARQSMQAEAVHLSALDEHELEAVAVRLRSAGLTVAVSP